MLPSGNPQGKILILGDYPSQIDKMFQQPLREDSASLAQLLHEAGMILGECSISQASTLCPTLVKGKEDYSTLLCHTKSPKASSWKRWHNSWVSPELWDECNRTLRLIEQLQPNTIVALGSLALFILCGHSSTKKWRGSQLRLQGSSHSCTVIPTYHPRYLKRDSASRAITVQDLRRAKRVSHTPADLAPVRTSLVRPTFAQAVERIKAIQSRILRGPTPISVDIETRAGHLACIGFALDRESAFCIPLMCVERPEGYWSHMEETYLVGLMREVLTHPNAMCFGQNFIYDVQYIYRFWFFVPTTWYDTMNAQHTLFPGTPKGLDYLASMYCEYYVYWKDDGKLWDASTGEDQLWTYNCEDCWRTFEVMEQQQPLLKQMGLQSVWEFQQGKLAPLLLKAMFRGVRCDVSSKAALSHELMDEITQRESWLTAVLGHPLNIQSPKQMQEFFYDDLKFKPVISRKTHTATLDDAALISIAKKEPLVQPLVNKIQELRSLKVFRSTFVEARLDRDQRLRSSYNITGTETFRLSSSENAFGSGLNFQNIPSGSEDQDDPTVLTLPNIRKLFIPDPGYTIFDMDLQSADFYTVVWEADDDEFRDALRSGIDMHGLNAKSLFGLSCGADEVKKLHNPKRQLAKIWCHATNYGAGAHNMSRACGITIHEAERLRARWFQMHPGILEWHKRTEAELHQHRRVSNAFGYRMIFFGRIDAALPEALAWRPQSTTGCVINRAWYNISQTIPEVEVLIQVHDSLVGQYPTHLASGMPERILAASRVAVPYPKTLIIPSGIKTSTRSWGDCA